MVEDPWVLAGATVSLLLHALVAYRVYRLQTGEPLDGDERTARPTVDDGTVECPQCGVDNDVGYRFCRSCVSELPGRMGIQRHTDGPLGRLTG